METYRRFAAAATEPSEGGPLDWRRDTPYPQPYYTFSPTTNRWQAIAPPQSPPSSSSTSTSKSTTPSPTPLTTFTIYSQNIDFMLPHASLRLTTSLNHLQTLTTSTSTSSSSIIFLQEMIPADLRTLQSHPWIRATYYLTDTSNKYWESNTYGTCTLVPKTLQIRNVFRVHYANTGMQRDGLFVDIDVDPDEGSGGKRRVVRLCNTHLESLALQPPVRPGQLATAARVMKNEISAEVMKDAEEVDVVCSVLGGDLNAIQDFDAHIAADNGLGDAYLVTGGVEGAEEGMTWGQMARTVERDRYGLSRMDKLLFWGSVRVDEFQRFGLGWEVPEDKEVERRDLIAEGLERAWVTDHVGVKGVFSISSL